MLSLVCVDVDGTLVGSGGEVLPGVWAAVERARSAGMRLALCSGRPAFGNARGYAERLDPWGWHVFQNGASVVNLKSGESRSVALPRGAIGELVERSRLSGQVLELYTDDTYAVESTGERARKHAELLGLPFEPRDLLSLRGNVVRAQWVVAREDGALEKVLPSAGDLSVSPAGSPVMPDTLFVSLTAPGVDKGSAVRAVAAAYKVPLERTMMVGDGHNDVVAMRAVGFAVAMGNADKEACAAATRRVADVDRGGLAEALEWALRL